MTNSCKDWHLKGYFDLPKAKLKMMLLAASKCQSSLGRFVNPKDGPETKGRENNGTDRCQPGPGDGVVGGGGAAIRAGGRMSVGMQMNGMGGEHHPTKGNKKGEGTMKRGRGTTTTG